MKIGDKIEFYLFGIRTKGEVYEVDKKNRTVNILSEDGYKYPNVEIIKNLPTKVKDIKPWYILKK